MTAGKKAGSYQSGSHFSSNYGCQTPRALTPLQPSVVQILKVSFCGDVVLAMLRRANTLRVIAGFKHSVYLQVVTNLPGFSNQPANNPVFDAVADSIFCIVDVQQGKGPLNCCVSLPSEIALDVALKPGGLATNHQASGVLQLSDKLWLDYSEALKYETTAAQRRDTKSLQLELTGNASEAIDLSRLYKNKFQEPGSLCWSLVQSLLEGELLAESGSSPDEVTRDFAAALEHLFRKRLQGFYSRVNEYAEKGMTSLPDRGVCRELGADKNLSGLIGLGQGLTPAGDDFLCGVLCLLYNSRYKWLSEYLKTLLEPQLAERTNVISAAHLKEAARGRVSEHSDAILDALQCVLFAKSGDDDIESTRANRNLASACNQVGASSGWDFMSGAAVGWLVLSQSDRDGIDVPATIDGVVHSKVLNSNVVNYRS